MASERNRVLAASKAVVMMEPHVSLPRPLLLVGAGACVRDVPGLRSGADRPFLPAGLLRLRRLELPQLCDGGAGGPLQVMEEARGPDGVVHTHTASCMFCVA